MSTELARNVAHAGLRAPATSGATSISVELITGAWPAVSFTAVMEDGTSRKEQVTVTGVSGNTLTVTRAQGGTSAVAHDTMSSVDVITTTDDLAVLETFLSGDSVAAHVAAADPHTGYLKEADVNAKGDLFAGTANDTVSRLAVGTNDHVLTADSAQATGIKWAASGVAAHEADTTAIHGITDTAQLALKNAANTFTENQTLAAGKTLLFAGDTDLFRDSAGILKTSQALIVGGATIAVGTLAAQADITGGSHVELPEISAPSAPAADKARLYVRDSGGGKTQLVVRFPTGAVQVIATEP